jgi:DNA invertase Pin-like site-specific DNA recombinase
MGASADSRPRPDRRDGRRMLALKSRKGPTPVVAIYARVSTRNKQELSNQTRELRLYAKRVGWEIFETYKDQAKGDSPNRPGLDAMLEAAARKYFDAVLIFDLSRLTRGGPMSAFGILQRLKDSGVELWSYREEWLRTPVTGPILFAIAAWIAQMEKEAIGARVRAGMARARDRGTKFGRPKVASDKVSDAELKKCRGQRMSFRQMAAHFKVGRGTIERRMNELEAKEKNNGTTASSAAAEEASREAEPGKTRART